MLCFEFLCAFFLASLITNQSRSLSKVDIDLNANISCKLILSVAVRKEFVLKPELVSLRHTRVLYEVKTSSELEYCAVGTSEYIETGMQIRYSSR